MKRVLTSFAFVLTLFTAPSPLLAQEVVTSTQVETTGDDRSFIERYYEIKETYPKMKDAFGKYAASTQTLVKFIERYNQIKDSYADMKEVYAHYAGSTHELADFAKRYYQIKDTYPDLDKIWGDFAASKY